MRIRNKILVYFSILSIVLVGIAFLVIYSLFSDYRREEFHQRIKDQTKTSLKFLVEVNIIDYEMMQTLDRYTINNLYSEKILIFNESRQLIYSSIDDTKIKYSYGILNQLSATHPEVAMEENGYDLVGIYFSFEGKHYYGIAKAYDQFGLSKLNYLRFVLLLIYICITTIILISSYWLSQQISQPIKQMTDEIMHIAEGDAHNLISIPPGKDEIHLLATHFNQMMQRLNDAYSFQKHAIHHISHELKTPIAILVSNFEKMEKEKDPEKIRTWIRDQKQDTRTLSDIINALLEISKVEASNRIDTELVRMDEMIFDVVQEMQILHPDFKFEIILSDQFKNESDLSVPGNSRLLRLLLINLAVNSIQYSNNGKAAVRLVPESRFLSIEFRNQGQEIREQEKQYLFRHFFRGENSKGKRGFGLGLVLISKVMDLHHGTITYSSPGRERNIFRIMLPVEQEK